MLRFRNEQGRLKNLKRLHICLINATDIVTIMAAFHSQGHHKQSFFVLTVHTINKLKIVEMF
jgi:hypothetical protein